MKIAFVQTAHLPLDERVFYHQTATLIARNDEILIVSTRTDENPTEFCNCFNDKDLSKKKLLAKIADLLSHFIPDVVICDTPWAVLGAKQFRKTNPHCKIVYDVTEWYPSKKNLQNHSVLNRFSRIFALSFLNIFAASKVNGFIFGEYFKAKPFRFFFPNKKFLFLSYYPDNKFIANIPLRDISQKCCLLYSGNLTEDKGYDKVMSVVMETAQRLPHHQFELTVLCSTPPESSLFQLSNLDVVYKSYLPFQEFCQSLGNYDLFLDLRKNDFENTHCLPIKIFYMMAAARPAIVTNLKSINKGIPDYECFSFLVNPEDIHTNAEIIIRYIDNPELYKTHCQTALDYSQNFYNWHMIASDFTDFLMQL